MLTPTNEKMKYTIASAALSGLQGLASAMIGGVAAQKGALSTAIKAANYVKNREFVKTNAIKENANAEQAIAAYENDQTPSANPESEAINYFQAKDTYHKEGENAWPTQETEGKAATPVVVSAKAPEQPAEAKPGPGISELR
jgi:hypothetical protein